MNRANFKSYRRNPIINPRSIGFTIAFAIVAAMLLLTGCGGGGGDSVSVNYHPSLPAGAETFTTVNAIDIAEDAAGSKDVFLARGESSSKPSARELIKLVNDKIADTKQNLTPVATGASQTEQCIAGDPTSGTVKIIYNSSATSYSFSFTFTNCNVSGINLHGIISSIANFNSAGDYDVRFGGDINYTFSDATTLSMVLSANETGNDLSYEFSVLMMDYSVIGDFGNYLVNTTIPLEGNYLLNQYYIGGEIIIQGADNTRVRITITDINEGTVAFDDGLGSGNFVDVVDIRNPIAISPCPISTGCL